MQCISIVTAFAIFFIYALSSFALTKYSINATEESDFIADLGKAIMWFVLLNVVSFILFVWWTSGFFRECDQLGYYTLTSQ